MEHRPVIGSVCGYMSLNGRGAPFEKNGHVSVTENEHILMVSMRHTRGCSKCDSNDTMEWERANEGHGLLISLLIFLTRKAKRMFFNTYNHFYDHICLKFPPITL